MSRCPGFNDRCDALATWTVDGTAHRGEWQACRSCAIDAVHMTTADAWANDGTETRSQHLVDEGEDALAEDRAGDCRAYAERGW